MGDSVSNIVATQTVESAPNNTQNVALPEFQPTVYADHSDMPLEIWDRENHTDYIKAVYNLEKDLPVEISAQVDTISKYIQEKMSREGYEPTTKAYRAMLHKIEGKLKIDRNVAREVRMAKISQYIEAERSLSNIKDIDIDAILRKLAKMDNTQDMKSEMMRILEKYL